MKRLLKSALFALFLLPRLAGADDARWFAALPEDYAAAHCRVEAPPPDERATVDFLAARNVTLESASDFTADEKEDVRAAFSLYPEYFLPFWISIRILNDPSICSIDPVTKIKTTIFLDDRRDDARLRICRERWNTYSRFERVQSIAHEFAHLLGNAARQADGSEEWIALSQSAEPRVSGYARTARGVTEDFAETVVAYRLTPDRLYGLSRPKYEFMRKTIFGGAEFRTDVDCARAPAPDLSAEQTELVEKMYRKSSSIEAFAGLYDRSEIRKKLGDSRFFVLLSARLGRLPYSFRKTK